MKFEENFPGLKGKEHCILKSEGAIIQKVINKGEAIIIDEKANIIFHDGYIKEDIQKYCIDKAKVKEVIDNFLFDTSQHYKQIEGQCDFRDYLRKELGLE